MTMSDGIPCVRHCTVRRGSLETEALICNLSTAGAYITFLRLTKAAIPETGQIVRLAFLLPGDATPFECEAVVGTRNTRDRIEVGGSPRGCELRFAALAPSDRARIQDLVDDYRNTPNPRIAVAAPHSGFMRIPYVEPCLLVGDSGSWEGVLCNLSSVGAYVTLDPAPPAGCRARLYFKTPDKEEPLSIQCEVAWLNPDASPRATDLPAGCGVQFTDLDESARAEIELLILEYESLPRP